MLGNGLNSGFYWKREFLKKSHFQVSLKTLEVVTSCLSITHTLKHRHDLQLVFHWGQHSKWSSLKLPNPLNPLLCNILGIVLQLLFTAVPYGSQWEAKWLLIPFRLTFFFRETNMTEDLPPSIQAASKLSCNNTLSNICETTVPNCPPRDSFRVPVRGP